LIGFKVLESLVTEQIRKQQGVKIVPSDYPEDFIAVVVVGAKLPNGRAGTWYITLSALLVSAADSAVLQHSLATAALW